MRPNEPASQPQEQAAFEILAGYGIDFIPVYIGRARAILCGEPDASPSAQQIVDCVIDLINLDEEQRLYLERREREMAAEKLLALIAAGNLQLSQAQTDELKALQNILREMVDLERAKIAAKTTEALPASLRISLYPDKVPRPGVDRSYVGKLRLGSRSFLIKAWLVGAGAGINLELKAM